MGIPEINKRIAELQLRLTKNLKVRDKHRTRKISPVLRNYISTEIKRLEKQKNYLLSIQQEQKVVTLNWKDIYFENGFIKFINEGIAYQIPSILSKKAFNYIKEFICRWNFDPIVVVVKGSKMLEVKNIEQLKKCIEFINLENIIYELPDVYDEEFLKGLVHQASSNQNDELIKLYHLKQKNEYFKYLCQIQNQAFKIIPLVESTHHSNGQSVFEEGFLFTVKSFYGFILIWENVNVFRATYLFEITDEHFYYSLYQILSFFAKESLNKRLTLKKNKHLMFSKIESFHSINHDSIEDWVTKVKKYK